jgi:phosphoribosylformimino-5-aminoimidazole carboxamide ribotide isomerase
MYIIPAIDLMDGRCVRLIQGQYDSQIVYRDDPLAQAQDFQAAGAEWLHVVDLDGAKAGKPANTETIARIVTQTDLCIEVGGGLRNEDSIRQLLDLGVTRAIIGTKAVSDFPWFSQMAQKFAGRLALGLDARGSTVATHGWLADSSLSILGFAKQAAELPLAAIIYTDISKDGMLCGPNIGRTQAVAEAVDIPVVASGGVEKLRDIKDLATVKVIDAVIAGRSLYEGTLDLKEAIAAAECAG